ncbi:helix-turn-helix domain-containing protein [Leeuwenhoekiella polynyae]|uniref:Helix-turn-helix protein n=1 Tax=Leeuwenhoekiella polynyae TaxID=1550906 RepID=A0A4Q0P1G9_9FLAO|nr:helix-turn-helix transcriptional regulator [Leeuwenhoekiella polynyae]RXG20334.1 helix-turn-helix protein [Leeuwenhoekiella polynyae]|tara:strand:- start:484 stop:723 length:240 start_codon:yes stop_codon:yes gene_type:complete
MISDQTYLLKFGENVLKRRTELKLSYRQLAQKCDLDFSAISKIEKGQKSLEFQTIIELAKGLDIHPRELFDFDFPINKV